MEDSNSGPTQVENEGISLPPALRDIPLAQHLGPSKQTWNSNEEIASLLITFEKHKDWKQREIKIRPPSGSMLLYSRNKVRYRKDGYCWKKRKDGKTIREDHMKLKVQGIECIYGSYVHSAVLPTFHRRCYWLLQNPDTVLVHYLNVPYTDNTKLTLPTLSYYMEKKEWTKEELVDQLRPMFCTGREPNQENTDSAEETIAMIVKQLLEHQDKHQKSKIHYCDALCDKNCSLRLITPKKESTQSQTSSAVNSRLISLIERNSTQHAQAMNPPSQLCPTSNANTLLVAPSGSQQVATMANLTDPHQQAGTPLILNLSNFQGSNGIIILSGQTNTPISIINSSCTQEPPTNSGNALVHFTTANAAPRPKLADVHAAKHISETSGNVPMQIGSSAEETGLDSGIKAENHNMFMPSEFAVSASIMQNSFSSSLAGSQADLNENSSAGQLNSPPGGVPANNCEPFKSDLPFPNSADLGFDNLDLLDFVDIEKLCPGWSDSCTDEVSSESIPQSTFNLASSENKTMSLISSPDCLGNQTSSKSTNCLQQQQHLHHPQTDASVGQQQSSAKPPLSLQALQLPTNPQQNSVNVTTQAHVYSQPCISQQQSPAQVHCSHPHILNQNQQTCAEINTPPHLLGKAASIELPPLHAPQGKDPSDVGRGKLPKQNSLGDITDFSPDWSYTQGGVKVLVTGPWLSASATYSCLFDSKSVGATLVQPGVLRCFAPEHEAGLVTLQVALGDCIISNSVVFEYKTPERRETTSATPDWFDVDENQLQLMLLDRLAQLEKRLGSSSISKDTNDQSQCGEKTTDSEAQLVRYCQFLSLRPWVSADQLPKLSAHGGTVLHLAAGLGYQKLIDLLIKWRSECRSPVLDSELDANSLDNFSASPLAWACARGHVISALFLYHWNSRPMKVCNKAGLSPLEVARNHGHFALADHLAMLEQESLMQTDHSSIGTPIPCITGFLLDSPSKGENCAAESVISGRLDDGVLGYSPQPPGGRPAPLPSLHIDIPAPHPSSPSQGKVCRRFSEQTSASVLRRRLNKRFSMEVFPDSAIPDFCSNPDIAVSQSLRVANSEPDLGANIEGLSREDNPMISEHSQDVTSPDLFLQNESLLGISRLSETGGSMFSSRWLSQPSTVHGSGVVAMDTDEISSVRSDSPFIDVEKLSDDELQNLAGQSKLGSESSNCDSQRQMVTLANQIIAAMPERIKSSPSRCDEGVVTECQRGRSESHSSVASQNSPPPSSYGDDSGISTPLGEGISFEDFRYGDIDTPASSLSPDSTCLPSPYSPYAFMLDSPPPTTAEFNEYFNAPSTFMEKDFSQLTLSDHEQRKLYEAAKLIQNAFRIYRDKQQQQQQLQKEIEAAILIQSYYRRYKQYIYYKKMTQAAVLIQSQFRSYSAQKRYKKSRDAAVVIQNQYRTYKQHERFKKSRNAAVIIQQRFRNHYQRKQSQEMASDLLQMASESNDNSPAQDASTSTTGDTTCVGTEAKKTTKTNEKTKKKKTAMLSRSSSVGKAKKSLQIDPDLRRPVSKSETQKNSAVKGDNCETSNQARRACSLSKTQL